MTEEEMEATLNRIEHTLALRWWLFGVMALALVVGAMGAVSSFVSVDRIEDLALHTDARSIRNESAIEAAFKQQIIYQQQIAQSIDFLAKKNPKINVPRAIVRPPKPAVTPEAPEGQLSDAQLQRSPKPTLTPTPSKQSTRHKKRKPSPTPGVFQRLFNPKSTR